MSAFDLSRSARTTTGIFATVVLLLILNMAAAKVIINDAPQQLVSIKVCAPTMSNSTTTPARTCDTNCTEYHAVAGGCFDASNVFNSSMASSFVFECVNATDGCLSAQRFLGPNCNNNAQLGTETGACNFCYGDEFANSPLFSQFFSCNSTNVAFNLCLNNAKCDASCTQEYDLPIGKCGNVHLEGRTFSALVSPKRTACSFVKSSYYENTNNCVSRGNEDFALRRDGVCMQFQWNNAYNVVLSCMSSNYFAANNKALPPHISQMPKEHVEALRKMIESDKKNKVAPLGMFGDV